MNLRIIGAFQIVPPARGNNPSRRSQQISSTVMSPGKAADVRFCPGACPLVLSSGISDCGPIRKQTERLKAALLYTETTSRLCSLSIEDF